jgi:hypothetical protein
MRGLGIRVQILLPHNVARWGKNMKSPKRAVEINMVFEQIFRPLSVDIRTVAREPVPLRFVVYRYFSKVGKMAKNLFGHEGFFSQSGLYGCQKMQNFMPVFKKTYPIKKCTYKKFQKTIYFV